MAGPLRSYSLGLLHGRLKAAEKDAVMRDFAAGRIQVLVATTVIEVGVDVPNAVSMVIENSRAVRPRTAPSSSAAGWDGAATRRPVS